MRMRSVIGGIFLTVLFGLFSTAFQSPAAAAVHEQEFCYSEYDWNELEIGSFVVMFTLEDTSLAQTIFTDFPSELQNLISEYSQIFKTNLVEPIVIRIYPSLTDFYCLNPVAPEIAGDATHAHIGEREVALFSSIDDIAAASREATILNALRHEIAVLFTESVTSGYAPPGLAEGVGGYAEDPAQTFEIKLAEAGDLSQPTVDWQDLWEDEIGINQVENMLQATSTVAYLIDVHGWGRFLDLLEEIKLQQGYRQALVDVYGVDLTQLQEHWEIYFPIYVSERWQVNIFHNYDLDTLRELIGHGAYQDSIDRLEEAVKLIGILGTTEELSSAEGLLQQAQTGVEAGELASSSRRLLFSGNYLDSYLAAEQAISLYNQLGDTRRISELETYMAVDREILDLRAGLNEIQENGVGFNPLLSQEVLDIGIRLLELGDDQGVLQAESILFALGVGQNTFFQLLISVVVLISTALIIRTVLSWRKEKPPEADLL